MLKKKKRIIISLSTVLALCVIIVSAFFIFKACTKIVPIEANYTVTYDKNAVEATGATENSSHAYGTAKALTANGFDREGYVFAGWNTKADGSGTFYADKQEVLNLSSENGAVVTLYAVWLDHAGGFAGTFEPVSISKSDVPAASLWKGEVFSGVFIGESFKILGKTRNAAVWFYGDGTGRIETTISGGLSGPITYTFSENVMALDFINESNGNPDSMKATVAADGQTIAAVYGSGIEGVTKASFSLTKAAEPSSFIINEDGTGGVKVNGEWKTGSLTYDGLAFTVKDGEGSEICAGNIISNNNVLVRYVFVSEPGTDGLRATVKYTVNMQKV